MKKLYSYDNTYGDKGIIIADSMEEAKTLHKEMYPGRNIIESENRGLRNEAYIFEEGILSEKSELFIICPY